MYVGEWTEIDEANKNLIEKLKDEYHIAYGLVDDNRAITLNMLIDFCKEQKIDFDKPIFLECPDGYFPLAHFHNAYANNAKGEYNLNLLAIADGDW